MKSLARVRQHADECVRLAGLTDDLIVRDQLLDLAQEWMLAARRARGPSDDTRVVSLHKTLGDNVVPLHTNQDDDDSWSPASKAVPLPQGSKRKVAPMTKSSPNVIEIKLDRLIDDMRFLRSQIIVFDRRLNGIEAYLKSSEPSEQQLESKSTPWFAAAARATAALFAVGAAVGAALLYLGTWADNRTLQTKIRSGCNHAPVNAAAVQPNLWDTSHRSRLPAPRAW
jgi:hypothetical protein